jgi:hypothetical protein
MTPEAREQTVLASPTPTAELLFTEHDATSMSTDEASFPNPPNALDVPV